MKTPNTPALQRITATELLLGAAEHDAISSGYTLLDREIVLGNIHNIESIIRQTSLEELSTPNGKGFTPLHAAVWLANEYIIEALLNRGVKVDILDSHKRTPLHWAAEFGNGQIIQFLLDHNACIKHRNVNQMSTQEVAEEAGYGAMFRQIVICRLIFSQNQALADDFEKDDRVNIDDIDVDDNMNDMNLDLEQDQDQDQDQDQEQDQEQNQGLDDGDSELYPYHHRHKRVKLY